MQYVKGPSPAIPTAWPEDLNHAGICGENQVSSSVAKKNEPEMPYLTKLKEWAMASI